MWPAHLKEVAFEGARRADAPPRGVAGIGKTVWSAGAHPRGVAGHSSRQSAGAHPRGVAGHSSRQSAGAHPRGVAGHSAGAHPRGAAEDGKPSGRRRRKAVWSAEDGKPSGRRWIFTMSYRSWTTTSISAYRGVQDVFVSPVSERDV